MNNNNLLIKTLQKKIIIITLFIQILISSLAGMFYYLNSKNIIIENAKQESINLIYPIQLAAKEKMILIPDNEDRKKYLNILLNFQGQTKFPTLKTRMPNLKEIYIYSNREDIHTLDKQPLWVFPELKKALNAIEPSIAFNKESFFVNIPIHLNEVALGGIILEYSKNKINLEKRKAFIGSISFALLIFLLSLLLIKLFAKEMTKPLQKIVVDLKEIAKDAEITQTSLNYSTLKNSELEPLIISYVNMKETIAKHIDKLSNEIQKRKRIEKEFTLNKKHLEETINEKTQALKDINILLKDEVTRRKTTEKKNKLTESILNTLLKTKYCCGVLILNQKGEVLKTNPQLSNDWDLPEDVITNDTEEQLIKYFSYQISNNKSFLAAYKKCKDNALDLGTFSLKNGKKTNISFQPLIENKIIIGKIFTFHTQS